MKKIKSIVLIAIVIGMTIFLYRSHDENRDAYESYKQININKVLTIDEDYYYVYFYKKNCPYCEEIERTMRRFVMNKSNLYFVNMDEQDNVEGYDWKKFRENNDIDIGVFDSNENKTKYYDGESEEKYINTKETNSFGKLKRFEIVVADDGYLEKNKKAIKGHVYATNMVPEIDYQSVENSNVIPIAGVPTLLKIENGKVIEFHFDSVEIEPYVKRLLE